MTDQEILTKAISKAEKNGFVFGIWKEQNSFSPHFTASDFEDCEIEHIKLLLTDHAFCKALFGTSLTHKRTHGSFPFPEQYWEDWQYHLQQMVITDNWLQYIKQFLEEK